MLRIDKTNKSLVRLERPSMTEAGYRHPSIRCMGGTWGRIFWRILNKQLSDSGSNPDGVMSQLFFKRVKLDPQRSPGQERMQSALEKSENWHLNRKLTW